MLWLWGRRWLKSRVTKVTKEKDNAIIERDTRKWEGKEKKANEIKMIFLSKKRTKTKEKEDVIKEMTNQREGVLSEEVKAVLLLSLSLLLLVPRLCQSVPRY